MLYVPAVVMSAVRFILSAFSVPVTSTALLAAFITVTVPLVTTLPVVASCTFTCIVVFDSVLLVTSALVVDGLCCIFTVVVVVVLLYSAVGVVSIVSVFSPKDIESNSRTNIPYMVLMDGLTPFSRSISRYRFILGCYYKSILSRTL